MAQQTNGSVSPTPRRALVVAALFGGLAGWLLAVTSNAFDLIPPDVPWTAPVGVALIAALVGVLAWSTHQRIQVRRERVEPQRAVAFLVLGKATALGGALVAGGYLGYALSFVARLDAEGPRQRVLGAAVTVLTGVGLSIAGLLLERACRVPRDDDEDEEGPARGDA